MCCCRKIINCRLVGVTPPPHTLRSLIIFLQPHHVECFMPYTMSLNNITFTRTASQTAMTLLLRAVRLQRRGKLKQLKRLYRTSGALANHMQVLLADLLQLSSSSCVQRETAFKNWCIAVRKTHKHTSQTAASSVQTNRSLDYTYVKGKLHLNTS